MQRAAWLLFLTFLLGACGSGGSSGNDARSAITGADRPLIVPPGKTLLFVGQATEPAVIRSMEDYVEHVGRVPAGFMFYLILSGDPERTQQELVTMQALLDRHPGTALQLALGYGPELTGNAKESLLLLGGRFDPELQVVADWLRSFDRPVLLRPLYEFDRACTTYGPAELYKPAYRYIVDRFRAAGVRNVSYVWQSAGPGFRGDESGYDALLGTLSSYTGAAADPLIAQSQGTAATDLCPIAGFYPGDGYVDYFAMSYWDAGSFNGPVTPEAQAAYQNEARRILDEARRLGLPLMIAESTPAFIGTTSGTASLDWMRRYFDLIEEYDIRVVSYIATEWLDEGGVWGAPLFNGFFPPDARVHADPAVLAYWRQRTAHPRYVQESDADIARLLAFDGPSAPLPWSATAEPSRPSMRWPDCPPPLLPGTGGWCLPLLP